MYYEKNIFIIDVNDNAFSVGFLPDGESET